MPVKTKLFYGLLRLPDPAFSFGEYSDEFVVTGPFD